MPISVLVLFSLAALDHQGRVTFADQPVPGASIKLTAAGRERFTATGPDGVYRFPGVDGAFTVEVGMQLFAPQRREFPAGAADAVEWVLELLPRDRVQATRQPPSYQRSEVTATAPPAPRPARSEQPVAPASPELQRQADEGFLVNGSVNHANLSPFAQLPAFGNNRRSQRSLYNGSLGLILNNAAFDARAYSLTGQNTLKPDYSRVQGLLAFGGPLRIPRLLERRGPQLTFNYQWTRNRNATTETALVPTAEQRNLLPAAQVSPQARALLALYPLPNFTGSSRYNFQLPLVRGLHQDDLQARGQKQVRRNNYNGAFSSQSTRTDSPSLFGFLDTGRILGWNATAGFRRNLNPRSFVNTSVNFNRFTSRTTPYFSGRENVSGNAGIQGNNQEPVNWGPPNLFFTSGIAPLTVDQASLQRNQTASASADWFVARQGHNVSLGYTYRRQQFNVLAQQDARGTFGFTGPDDFLHFLRGTPDTSAIAFGNADKYLRGRVNEAFVNDDWRLSPALTINAGLRWEYWSPVTEKYGRLVNLSPVTGAPNAVLPRPDRNNLAPRVGLSWRPLAASSIVVRAGYGVYYDTSIYQPIALEMAQQAPLSRSLRVANTPATPLTLANGFRATGAASATTFGVDPGFRTGYAHTWRASVQSDLPAALQFSATYTGSKGTRGQQQILPNTFPGGLAVPPFGFAYLLSDGNSIRHAGEFQLRRRLRSGLTAELRYTWAKSLDNALPGGRGRAMIAQNWQDLSAERGRSNFDQRHLVNATFQYTTGKGLRARWMKDWTLASQLNAGTGLPLTPLLGAALIGYNGILRPDAPAPGVFAAPAPGRWGNAGRNTIGGPRQFGVTASLGRTLRSWDRVNLDLRIDAANATNTPTFPAVNTTLGHAQFGLPMAVNPMRTAQVTLRAGF